MLRLNRLRVKRVLLSTISLCLITAGCASSAGRWQRADYELNTEHSKAKSRQPLSSKIYLISDNQRHELLGDAVRIFRMSVSDEKTPVAIRPPQLDLFGQDLLREAVSAADGFILHLGDACDVSNTGEFANFAWDMRSAAHGWVMAPGNHDGFFFGNSSRVLKPLVREWNESAETYLFDGETIDSRAMQKDRFVSFYIASLILQDATWSAPLARSLGADVERHLLRWREQVESVNEADGPSFAAYWAALDALQNQVYDLDDPANQNGYHTFELPTDVDTTGQPHLRRITWNIAKTLAWRSFVVQEVDITAPATSPSGSLQKTSILVLDSSQYNVQPSLEAAAVSKVASTLTGGFFDEQAAGLHGNVLESQEKAANEFVRSMKREGRRWMLATHHPYRDLGRRSKPRFDQLRNAGGIPVSLSSHSHTGEILWHRDDDHEGSWLEINVGSILDAPAEFRDLQLMRVDDRLAIRSDRHPMEGFLRERGLIADDVAAYRPAPGDDDYYMNYETQGFTGTSRDDWSARNADFRVKQLLLAAYQRLFTLFEADAADQSSIYWPTGPDGSRLDDHEKVTSAISALLAETRVEELKELTQFLYELREFDRTRSFSPAVLEKLRSYRLSQAIWAAQAEYRTWKTEPRGIVPAPTLMLLPASAEVGPRGR